jgi:shikimate dehydrogenase
MRKISENQTLVTEDLIHSDMVVIDVVYNPRVTQLLKEAKKAGAKTVDGSSMLVYQGAEQFKIFTGRKAPIKIMRRALLEVLDENSSKKN